MIDSTIIQRYIKQLDNHPVYQALEDVNDLRCFMQHHVYSVWDFMSLIKFLQNQVAPATYPWLPRGSADVRRFINELVLEEESDETEVTGEFSSHFELYQRAMKEVGADTTTIETFIRTLQSDGLSSALSLSDVPAASAIFTQATFEVIQTGRAHEVAAFLALGREHIIPTIFRSILAKTGISESIAPIFHFYLNRHIHLDEDFHAPLSIKLLNEFIDNDEEKYQQAIVAADKAVTARLQFWDGVLDELQRNKENS